MIYTSYFGNVKKLKAENPSIFPVSIAGRSPKGFDGMKFTPLAPLYSWWKEWREKFGENPDSAESVEWYSRKYKDTVLGELNPKTVAELLETAASKYGKKDVILLCYETPDRFCHRKLIEEWLNATGIRCSEYGKEK